MVRSLSESLTVSVLVLFLITIIRVNSACEEIPFPTTVEEFRNRLVELEQRYGGLQRGNVSCHHLKTVGRRTPQMCTGGDRMTDKAPSHNYGPTYSEVLFPMGLRIRNVAEVGILRGSGIAMWSTIFPKAQIYGFDMFLNHTLSNMAFLRSQGAFCTDNLHLHEMNQMQPADTVSKIGVTYDVVVDDGYHSDEASWKTWMAFEPFLASRGVYVIEDCACNGLIEKIRESYPKYRVAFKNTSTKRARSYMILVRRKSHTFKA